MIAALIIIAALGGLFYASYSIRSGVYVRAHCKGRADSGAVALTFDDGPDPVQTPKVLDVLRRHGVKASFFLIGERVDANPEIVARIVAEGHWVGNHSYSHKPIFPLMRRKRMGEDVEKCRRAIERASGICTDVFRPPFGVTNPTVAGVVRDGGYKVAGWSVRSLDTMGRSRDRVADRVGRRLKPGAVILLHDDRQGSETLLEAILGEIEGRGLRAVRLDELLDIGSAKVGKR